MFQGKIVDEKWLKIRSSSENKNLHLLALLRVKVYVVLR